MTPQEKTFAMKEAHIFFRLKGMVERYRLDSEWVGDRTKKYLLSHAQELEDLIRDLQVEISKIKYEEVR